LLPLHRVPASFRTLKGKFRLIRIGGALGEAYALSAYCRQRTLAAKSCNLVKDRPSNFFKRFFTCVFQIRLQLHIFNCSFDVK
jgi:hypothetical protein